MKDWLKRKLSKWSGVRYYGDGGTIHSNQYLDIETFHGTVVAVWFRCQPLPFRQTEVEGDRAREMERMYGNPKAYRPYGDNGIRLHGVEVSDKKEIKQD